MKKVILIFFIIFEIIYADQSSINKINRLENTLKEINTKLVHISDNQKKYNQLMTKYKNITSKFQDLIELCKKNNCNGETVNLNKNFERLKESIRTLNDMMETDTASLRSLNKQGKSIKGLIEMEKAKAILTREEVERVIDDM